MAGPRLIFLRLELGSEGLRASSSTLRQTPATRDTLLRMRPWHPKSQDFAPDSPFYVGETRGDAGTFPEELERYLRSRVPAVEAVGRGGAYLDLSGCDRILPDSGAFLTEIAAAVWGMGPTAIAAGEGGTRLVARLAAAVAPVGSWWAVEQAAAFLAPFPLRCLADEYPAPVHALEQMGLRKLGELAAMPPELLRRALGDEALLLWREARGEGDRRLAQPGLPQRLREPHRFVRPESDHQLVRSALMVLADRLAVGLRGRGLATARLELSARFHGGGRIERRRRVDPPSAALSRLRPLAGEMWSAVEPRRTAVMGCELRAAALREAPAESLALDFGRAREDLSPFIAQVRERFGNDALRWSPELWMDR